MGSDFAAGVTLIGICALATLAMMCYMMVLCIHERNKKKGGAQKWVPQLLLVLGLNVINLTCMTFKELLLNGVLVLDSSSNSPVQAIVNAGIDMSFAASSFTSVLLSVNRLPVLENLHHLIKRAHKIIRGISIVIFVVTQPTAIAVAQVMIWTNYNWYFGILNPIKTMANALWTLYTIVQEITVSVIFLTLITRRKSKIHKQLKQEGTVTGINNNSNGIAPIQSPVKPASENRTSIKIASTISNSDPSSTIGVKSINNAPKVSSETTATGQTTKIASKETSAQPTVAQLNRSIFKYSQARLYLTLVPPMVGSLTALTTWGFFNGKPSYQTIADAIGCTGKLFFCLELLLFLITLRDIFSAA